MPGTLTNDELVSIRDKFRIATAKKLEYWDAVRALEKEIQAVCDDGNIEIDDDIEFWAVGLDTVEQAAEMTVEDTSRFLHDLLERQ